jgi:phosphoribosylglycinamide formyltransferase 1
MRNLVVLISGEGSNMRAIAAACQRQAWTARIAAVIANTDQARGLSVAKALGLHTDVVDHRQFPDRSSFDQALARRIDAHDPVLVVLAGFMRVLGEAFVRHYADRLVNIHPSLLPAFPGLDTHRRALQAGVKVHGASVHLVTPDLDGGPILAQAVVPVLAGDDAGALAARVRRAEHELYPRVLGWLLDGRLRLSDGQPHWLGADRESPPAQALWCP